jgi:hypothetical protein
MQSVTAAQQEWIDNEKAILSNDDDYKGTIVPGTPEHI